LDEPAVSIIANPRGLSIEKTPAAEMHDVLNEEMKITE
jgi:hypothetical protein